MSRDDPAVLPSLGERDLSLLEAAADRTLPRLPAASCHSCLLSLSDRVRSEWSVPLPPEAPPFVARTGGKDCARR